jgi:hypothetical protein
MGGKINEINTFPTHLAVEGNVTALTLPRGRHSRGSGLVKEVEGNVTASTLPRDQDFGGSEEVPGSGSEPLFLDRDRVD